MTLQPMLLALALALAAPLAQAQVSAEPAPTRFAAADTNDDGKVDRWESTLGENTPEGEWFRISNDPPSGFSRHSPVVVGASSYSSSCG